MIEIIPDAGDLAAYVEFAEENSLGFEYNDFFAPDMLDDREELNKRIALYKSLGRPSGRDTMHGAFFDIVPFSWDNGIRRHSVYRMRQSVEIASELGCRAVVFHTGLVPGLVGSDKYRGNWLKSMGETVRQLLNESEGVEIYMENMFDETPDELRDLAIELQDEKRFGLCLDVAHVMLTKCGPQRWFQELAPYIRHFHLNDNHLERDEHLPMGEGSIDWKYLFRLIEENGLNCASALLEMNGLDQIRKSLDFVKTWGNFRV